MATLSLNVKIQVFAQELFFFWFIVYKLVLDPFLLLDKWFILKLVLSEYFSFNLSKFFVNILKLLIILIKVLFKFKEAFF